MDGLRNYPDEPEQRWYSDSYRVEGNDRYDGYRVPDPRYPDPARSEAAGESWDWGLGHTGTTGDLPGSAQPLPEPPAAPPVEEPEHYRTQPIDRAALQRAAAPVDPANPLPPVAVASPPPAGPPPAARPDPGGAVYRTRRAGAAALLAGGAIFAELLLVRVLLVAEFGSRANQGGVLAALFALAGVPLVTLGLHALINGPTLTGTAPGRSWLRAPLAYLPIGLILLIAAALAVR